MNVAVIGHLCMDVILYPDGTETRSPGGIYFSVAALGSLLGPRDTVAPVFGVGRAEYDEIISRFRQYPAVDTAGIFKMNGPTNQVELVYTTNNRRTERSQFIAEPIPWKRIQPQIRESDMILVNMISGFDITLDVLDEIRMAVRERGTPVYMDVHSLTLGITGEYERFHRPLETWRRWLFMLHAAQMNEEEAAVLSPEKLDEVSLAKHVLSLGTRAFHITRGERGSTLYVDERKRVRSLDIPPSTNDKAVDPTGCGDVFAAAYCAHYVARRDIEAAARYANTVAGCKARYPGSNDIGVLASFRMGGTPREVQST